MDSQVITEKAETDIQNFLNKKFPVSQIDEDKFVKVQGYDFNQGNDYKKIIESMKTTGLQATNLGLAIDLVQQMVDLRQQGDCQIVLGYTSNLISSGLREIFNFLAKNKLVDCIVSSCGGIEEDFIKCQGACYMGKFQVNDIEWREKGLNRIGNMVAPNDNYCDFEDFIIPIFKEMNKQQKENGHRWTPSQLIKLMGKKIDNEESVYYWCQKNDIEVFCPAISDGSIGDMMFFHACNDEGLVMDTQGDKEIFNNIFDENKKVALIMLGGGLIRHQILKSLLDDRQPDLTLFVTTANESDGSFSGSRVQQDKENGFIKEDCQTVKIGGDATVVFPIIVAETFAKIVHNNQ